MNSMLLLGLTVAALQKPPQGWELRADLQTSLPESIRILQREDTRLPLRAWLVEARPDKSWRPEASVPAKGLRTTTRQAGDLQALVAINAGFFSSSGSVSVVIDEGKLVAKGVSSVQRESFTHPLTRAAIGFDTQGRADCAWIWCADNLLYALDEPLPNAPGKPAQAPAKLPKQAWVMDEVLGGGPMLVSDGKRRITEQEECFQSIGGETRHPRTAAGYAKDGRLLLLVVDGRSKRSRGATLNEAAEMLLAFGAQEALNLDGGGSTTLVVREKVVNEPCDVTGERPVASVLALVSNSK
ncbi:MAG: hypothetical protein RL277_230 [Planctomycetota bacterium]|jgi:hypothetical protein